MSAGRPFNPLTITVIHDLLVSVAEEMGEALVRSAVSPNIRERRDLSCALFDGRGRLVAQASHIPVHLGSVATSVEEVLKLGPAPGDMILLNDPYRGGAHLPDLTLVAPFAAPGETAPSWFVAARAHHSDVGGMTPGSMGPATDIYQEGLILPPVRIVRGGVADPDILAIVESNSRTPVERRFDIEAQIGAARVGLARLGALVDRVGAAALQRSAGDLLAWSEERMRALVRALPEGRFAAEDHLDDDGAGSGRVPLRVELRREHADLVVDFSGSSPQTTGNVNTVESVVRSAVLYVLSALAGSELPVNAGGLAPVRLVLPPRCVINAERPAAVAAGNVETSQRIVDVLLRALAQAFPERIPAASCGSMNNVMLGGVRADGTPFAYYETIAGGMGAGPGRRGLDAVQTHMTNTKNTPVEIVESEIPVVLERYAVRRDSGGRGRHRGGDGVIREFRFLSPITVSLNTDRRTSAPWGLDGGADGAPGRNTRVDPAGRSIELPGKVTYTAAAGERLVIETPGGGGFGKEE